MNFSAAGIYKNKINYFQVTKIGSRFTAILVISSNWMVFLGILKFTSNLLAADFCTPLTESKAPKKLSSNPIFISHIFYAAQISVQILGRILLAKAAEQINFVLIRTSC